MSIDLTITSHNDGTGDEHGMDLAELEQTLGTLRQLGGDGTTRLSVAVNTKHRIRSVTASVEPGQPDHPRSLPDAD